jgi:hypothetical protein
MKAIGLTHISISPGQAEVGFLIPRGFFKNQLEPLVKELGAINNIIRIFSEVTHDGSAEQVEVRQISTIDPQFFFGLDPVTVLTIGSAVTWAINLWGKVEKIRKVRAETALLSIHTEKELQSLFDDRIEEKIAEAVKYEVERIHGPDDGKAGRRTELRNNHIGWALRSLLARIERGIQIEIRSLSPPPSTETSDSKAQETFGQLEEVKRELVYPDVEGTPVLKLPPSEPPPESVET